MSEPSALDEADFLWAAALLEGVDAIELSSMVDVATLATVVAEAEAAAGPVDAAALLLVAMVRRRPFPSSNAAIGWLVSVDWLARAHLRVFAAPPAVVGLCSAIRCGSVEATDVASRIRAWVIEEGVACPTCGRRVYTRDPLARRSLSPAGAPFELTARCAFEHRSHDRFGRPPASPRPRPVERPQPILASGECGSFLVAGTSGCVAVSPFCDDPPLLRVVEVDDLCAGDLVGRWDSLIERSTTLGFIPAAEATPDEHGRIDLSRLDRALRARRRPAAGDSGDAGESPAHDLVGSS